MANLCIFNYKKTKKSFLLLNIPHSGRNYLNLFKSHSSLSMNELRKSEDAYIDLLLEHNFLKYNLLKANFPRIFVDLNRSPLELDASMWKGKFNKTFFNRTLKVEAGIGVIPKVCFSGKNIYKDLFFFKEARKRLLNYYFPYHKKIKKIIQEIKLIHNKALVLDCHSMSSEIVDSNIDIVLSNNLGKSADTSIIDKLKSFFNLYGYEVKINTPFTGGFITKHYGKPMNNIHVIQIEINKKIYFSEKEFTVKNKNFNKLKNCFSDIINYINLNNKEF